VIVTQAQTDELPLGDQSAEFLPDSLEHIPLFSGLQPEEQQALRGVMRLERVPANQTICWLGERGDKVYLINSGKVVVTVPNEKGEHVVLNHLGPGNFFGEISLLDGGPRTATVRAVEPTTLCTLGRDDFHTFLRQRPQAAIDILTVMGQRQRGITETIRGMSNPNIAFERTRTGHWERISDGVVALAASQAFTIFHMAWFGLWMIFNLLAGAKILPFKEFDPFPFGLLTLVVSLEAIFLSIFVLVSQSREAAKDRLQIDLDYQVNLKAQTEIMTIMRKLEHLETLLSKHEDES
jgi:uncharacterized membrane protein